MIVAGGMTGVWSNFPSYLDSVEVLEGVDGSWRSLEAKLPRAMQGIRGITLNNVIYMIGEYQFNINLSIYLHSIILNVMLSKVKISGGKNAGDQWFNTILQYMPDEEKWIQAGNMLKTREWHSVGLVDWQMVKQFCMDVDIEEK